MVVIAHIPCSEKLFGIQRGPYAVSIFYILSSFLCMYTSDGEVSIKTKLQDILRKILKLVPLYYLFTIFTFIIALIKPNLFNTTSATAGHLVKSLLFIPYQNENGLIRPILDVTWFLVLIVWFYLLFGLSRIISGKYRGIVCMLILTVILLTGKLFFNQNALFVQYKSSVFSLFLGIALYYMYHFWVEDKSMKLGNKKLIINVFLYAVFLIAALPYSFFYDSLHILVELIPMVVSLIFILLSRMCVNIKVINLIASVSYSLYLCHEFIVKGFSRLVYSLEELNVLAFLLSIICVVVSIGTAILVNHYVEQPINHFITTKLYKSKRG